MRPAATANAPPPPGPVPETGAPVLAEYGETAPKPSRGDASSWPTTTSVPFTTGGDKSWTEANKLDGGKETDHSGVHVAGDAPVQLVTPFASNARSAPVVLSPDAFDEANTL